MRDNSFTYVGGELELFSRAANWKMYIHRKLSPYISGDVLEVGAGIGETTRILSQTDHVSWFCLEPDNALVKKLSTTLSTLKNRHNINFKQGFLSDLLKTREFDTILYIDVLEHIEKDANELQNASQYLRGGGRLIILVPAHQCLYTPFDWNIGHFRRYNKKNISSIVPGDLYIHKMFYMDSMGLIASLSNKLILKNNMPSLRQILVWDRFIVPLSTVIDLITNYSIGKTLVCILRKKP